MTSPEPISYERHVEQLAVKLEFEQTALKESGEYYDATHRIRSIGLATPPQMRSLSAAIGWARMYLDAVEERLDLNEFRIAGQSVSIENLADWWQANAMDEESSMAHLDALIYGRSYVTIAAPGPGDEPGVPIIRVESPINMFAEIDPRTRTVTRAIRLYSRQDEQIRYWATLFLPNETVPLRFEGGDWIPDGEVVRHNLGIVPVVPILNRERLADRDGCSEITPEIRTFTDAAGRTMMNMQAASELMAVPQRVLFGVSSEDLVDPATGTASMDVYLARILALENEAGKAFQFSAAELRNFSELLDQLAKHVASYTGLPPQYLSFQSDNPASAEAIKSSESRLVKKAERKARMFGGSWEQVMRIATKIITGSIPPELYRLESVWADPSTPTFASKADAVTKLYSNGTGVIPKKRARIDLGYKDDEIIEMEDWDKDDSAEMLQTMAAVTRIAPKPVAPPTNSAPVSDAA